MTELIPRTGPEHLAFWQAKLDRPQFAYVIQGEPGTPIKVGKADSPLERLAEFQTGNHVELRLLYVAPGGYELERELHYRLRDSRVRGEWFAEPGIEGFLIWMHRYCEKVIAFFEATGQLPPIPTTHQNAKGHYVTRNGANLIHRWRMSQPVESPMTVRFVDPDPLSPEEIIQRVREIEDKGYRAY